MHALCSQTEESPDHSGNSDDATSREMTAKELLGQYKILVARLASCLARLQRGGMEDEVKASHDALGATLYEIVSAPSAWRGREGGGGQLCWSTEQWSCVCLRACVGVCM